MDVNAILTKYKYCFVFIVVDACIKQFTAVLIKGCSILIDPLLVSVFQYFRVWSMSFCLERIWYVLLSVSTTQKNKF